MDEKYSCPHCLQHMVIEDAPLGALVKCPNCRKEFNLPSEPSLRRHLKSPYIWCLGAALGAVICMAWFWPSKPQAPQVVAARTPDVTTPPASTGGADDEAVYQGKPLRVWIDALDTSGKRDARDEARKVIQELGAQIVPAAIRVAKDTTAKAHYRGNAAYALGFAGSKEGAEAKVLIELLKDGQEYVRYSAIDALRHLKPEPGIIGPLAMEMLSDPSTSVRRHAAVVVGEMGPAARDALPLLQKLLNDEAVRTREAVTNAIAKITAAPKVVVPASTTPVLAAQLDPPKFAFANERLTAAANDMASTDPLTRAKAVLVVKETGKAAVPDFIRCVADRAVVLSERRIAAEALGYVGNKEGPEVQVLLTATADADYGVRANALKSLGLLQIDPKILVPLSIRMLDDTNNGGRRRAAENLANLGAVAKSAIPVLQSKANDKVRDTREAVNAALKKILAAVEAEEKGTMGKQ